MPRSKADWDRWFNEREGGKNVRKNSSPSIIATGYVLPNVVGEAVSTQGKPRKSKIHQFAKQNSNNPAPAELEFQRFLNKLNGGVLRDKFKREHVISGKWISDFFFPDIRLAIELDGSYHLRSQQITRDRQKDEDCEKFDITVLRITNKEVFGDQDKLTEKLRGGWRRALDRKNHTIGTSYDEYMAKGNN